MQPSYVVTSESSATDAELILLIFRLRHRRRNERMVGHQRAEIMEEARHATSGMLALGELFRRATCCIEAEGTLIARSLPNLLAALP
jgi:hypothetical protein